jgi:hypothetical protein
MGSNSSVGPVRNVPGVAKAVPARDKFAVLGIDRAVRSMRCVTGVCCCCHKFLLMLGVTP